MPKIIKQGIRDYPLGNAYCLVPIGRSSLVYREYARRFRKGITVHIDHDKFSQAYKPPGKTGKELLDRFYELKLAPLTFKWIKAKTSLQTSHWICIYPAHYMCMVELSENGMHAKDHLATLYYRGDRDRIQIAQQEYEGHLRGNSQYEQPTILQEELREWRLNKGWFQDAITRETIFEV